jgi:cyclopropane fatty-acyl-phospholipid synthase-like methyltransferase
MSSNASSPPAVVAVPSFWTKLRIELVGLAQDFWKDPKPLVSAARARSPKPTREIFRDVLAEADDEISPDEVPDIVDDEKLDAGHWRADRIQVMQKIWGDGYVAPGGDAMVEDMTAGANISKGAHILDLAAGLGGSARYLASKHDVMVTGLESDALLAKRATMMSLAAGMARNAGISPYDPETFNADKKYDLIFARALFFRVVGKARFFQQVAKSVEADGRIVFADYLIEPTASSTPEVAAWVASRRKAAPLSLSEMHEMWAALGFEIEAETNETQRLLTDIMRGLARFTTFLSEHKPDGPTKAFVFKEIETWAHNVTALKHGLTYYRFIAKRK